MERGGENAHTEQWGSVYYISQITLLLETNLAQDLAICKRLSVCGIVPDYAAR